MKKNVLIISTLLIFICSCTFQHSDDSLNDPSNCSCPDGVVYVSILREDQLGYDDYHGVYKIDTLAPDKHQLYMPILGLLQGLCKSC